MARLTLKETMDRLLLLIRSGYPVIYIVSHEETRVLDYLAGLFRVIKAERPQKHLLRWTESSGLQEIEERVTQGPRGQNTGRELSSTNCEPGAVPEDWMGVLGLPDIPHYSTIGTTEDPVLDTIAAANPDNNETVSDSLTVFFDIHQYLRDMNVGGALLARPPLVRPLRNAADALRRYYDENRDTDRRAYKTIVIVAPSASGLSSELERDLIVVDFPLPERPELLATLKRMVDRGALCFPDKIPDAEKRDLCGDGATDQGYRERLSDLVAGAGRGLAMEDYRLGLNMFAVRKEPLSARHVEDMLNLKAKAINNQALQYTPHVDIELGGLLAIREWVAMRRGPITSPELRRSYHLPPPRGVMLCGASGGGKSQLAKLIAKEFNLALLRLDVGALFGMYIGESEERTRVALQLAEVLAPVVLWLDEVDKAFRGVGAGGDNGVSSRVFGHFLTWLAEKQDEVFVVATANDYTALLAAYPEFGRKGRFDEIFWVPLPDQQARLRIFRIYLRPHLNDGYLEVTSAQVDSIAKGSGLVVPVATTIIAQLNATVPEKEKVSETEGDLVRFCWLLSQPGISQAMTGAEIEYAVTEALYDAYERDRKGNMHNTFAPDTILEVVKSAGARALYRPGTNPRQDFDTLENNALAIRNWSRAQ